METVAGLGTTADAVGLTLFAKVRRHGRAAVIPAVGFAFVADAASNVSRGLR